MTLKQLKDKTYISLIRESLIQPHDKVKVFVLKHEEDLFFIEDKLDSLVILKTGLTDALERP